MRINPIKLKIAKLYKNKSCMNCIEQTRYQKSKEFWKMDKNIWKNGKMDKNIWPWKIFKMEKLCIFQMDVLLQLGQIYVFFQFFI